MLKLCWYMMMIYKNNKLYIKLYFCELMKFQIKIFEMLIIIQQFKLYRIEL